MEAVENRISRRRRTTAERVVDPGAVACRMKVPAGVAELADARDSKSRSPCESVGSTPSSGTKSIQLQA